MAKYIKTEQGYKFARQVEGIATTDYVDAIKTIANNAQTTADSAQATIENHPINLQWGTYEAVIDDANLLTQEDINHQPDRFKEILSEYPDMKFYQVNRVLSFGEVSGIPSPLESVLYSSYMLYREGVSGASTLTYVHITNKNVEFLFNENGYLRSIVAYYRGKPIALALHVALGGTTVFMPYLCYVDEYNRTMNFSCATIDNEQKMSLFPAYGGKLLFEEDAFPAIATQISNAVAQKSQVQIVEQNVSEFLPTLTIHKLTQDEYNQKLDAGALDANTLYLTPDEEIDVAGQINEAIKNKSDIGHTHTAAEVGADANGSAASALISAKSYTDTKISELINSAPSTLDTLGEIATAMSENTDVVAALDNAIGTKANSSDLNAHINNTSNPHKVTLSQLGVTATPAELNYVSGVDSNVQEQLSRMSSLIGDVAVSAQINSAVSQKSQVQIITWEADD
jgi:hypothetical protein